MSTPTSNLKAKSNLAAKMDLRESVIRTTREMLAQLPFMTLYSSADVMFDIDELDFGDQRLARQIAFLKHVKLEELTFSDTNDPAKFTVGKRGSLQSIKVSNRNPTRGEMRSWIFRDYLEQAREANPKETAYEALSRSVKSLDYSDTYTMLEGAFTTTGTAMTYKGHAMTKEHFRRFASAILVEIEKKIKAGIIPANLEPKQIRRDPALLNSIWSGIDIGQFFDETADHGAFFDVASVDVDDEIYCLAVTLEQLQGILEEIAQKTARFNTRGHIKAAHAAKAVSEEITAAINELCALPEDEINPVRIELFKQKCNQAISTYKPELEKHRGWSETFLLLSQIISMIAGLFGKKTETAKKVQQIQTCLDHIKITGAPESPTKKSRERFFSQSNASSATIASEAGSPSPEGASPVRSDSDVETASGFVVA